MFHLSPDNGLGGGGGMGLAAGRVKYIVCDGEYVYVYKRHAPNDDARIPNSARHWAAITASLVILHSFIHSSSALTLRSLLIRQSHIHTHFHTPYHVHASPPAISFSFKLSALIPQRPAILTGAHRSIPLHPSRGSTVGRRGGKARQGE